MTFLPLTFLGLVLAWLYEITDNLTAPILAHRCTPCHFAGGKMYARLPFDRPETIVKLGERLFTRIKDEQERATIRKFLAGVQR